MKKGKKGVSDTSSDAKVRRGLWSRLFRKECEVSQQSEKASLLDSPDKGEECSDDASEVRRAAEPSSLADEITVSSDIPSQINTTVGTSCAVSESDEAYHRRVAILAKAIWNAEGCPEGMAEEHWFRAERELRRE